VSDGFPTSCVLEGRTLCRKAVGPWFPGRSLE
jgi:hypothetical protein